MFYQLAAEVVIVGPQIEVAVAAEVDEDGAADALLLAALRLLDGGSDGVVGLRRGDDALGAGEKHASLEALHLVVGARLDELVFEQLADHDAGAVVAQPPGVDGRGHEGMSQGVHRQQGRHAHRVAEVVAEDAAGELGAGGRLGSDAADVAALLQVEA